LKRPGAHLSDKHKAGQPSKWLLFSLAGTGLLLYAGLQALPGLVDEKALRLSIEQGLNDATGVHFQIRNLSLKPTLFHHLQVNLDTNAITDNKHHPLGSIRNITFEIRYLPLLLARIPEISKIHLNHVSIPIQDYSLFKALKLQTKPPPDTGFIKPAQLRDTELLLTDFEIIDYAPDKTAALLLARADGASAPTLPTRFATMTFRLSGPTFSLHHLQSQQNLAMLGKGRMAFENISPLIQRNASQKTLWQGDFNFQADLDQDALKEGHAIAAVDLKRLLLTLNGQRSDFKPSSPHLSEVDRALEAGQIKLDTRYDQRNNGHLDFVWKRQAANADGVLSSDLSSLAHGQALLLQMANVFSIEAPLPARSLLLSGLISSDVGFEMNFRKPAQPFEKLSGAVQLTHVVAEPNGPSSLPMITRLNGRLLGHDDRFVLQSNALQNPDTGLRFRVSGIPLHLTGFYRLSDEQMDFRLHGGQLPLNILKPLAQPYLSAPAMAKALKDDTIQGQLTVDAHLWGNALKPQYNGQILLNGAGITDTAMGIQLNGISGQARFAGAGTAEKAQVSYQAQAIAKNGQVSGSLQLPAQSTQTGKTSSVRQWAIHSLNGTIRAVGAWKASNKKPALPKVSGLLTFAKGQAAIPNTQLSAQDIQGKLRLENNSLALDDTSALLEGQRLQAQGTASSDLKQYQLRLWGQGLSLPVLSKALLPSTEASKAIKITRGAADFDIRVRNGRTATTPDLSGNATIQNLAIQTPQADRAVNLPRLTMRFTQQQLALEPTTLLYRYTSDSGDGVGTVRVSLGGQMRFTTGGHYDVALHSEAMPLALLRDLQAFTNLSGGDNGLPEVWNTAGTVDVQAYLANAQKQVHLNFHNAGLSWQDGDFPVYGLNGALSLRQQGGGVPLINSHNLHFVYGRSPIALDLENDQDFRLAMRGLLSALTVNHFLVSPQSEATPYHDIAFTAQATGTHLQAIPEKNAIALALHLDLGRALMKASQEITKPPVSPNTSAAPPEPMERHKLLRELNPLRLIARALDRVNESVSDVVHLISEIGEPRHLKAQDDPTVAAISHSSKIAHLQKNPSAEEATALQLRADEETAPALKSGKENQKTGAANNDNQKALFDVQMLWRNGNLDLQQAKLHLFDAGDILAQGLFTHPLKPTASRYQLHIASTPAVKLDALANATDDDGLFHGAKGSISGDLTVMGTSKIGQVPHLKGWLAAENVQMPTLTLRQATGRVDLAGQSAIAQLGPFELPGVRIKDAKAQSENIFESPMTLEQVVINAQQLDMAGISNFNNQVFKPILIDRIAHNYLRPWQLGDPILPVQFRNGTLSSDELIYQNILMSRLSSQLSVYANGFCELSNTQVAAAGGQASGYLSMNANDNNFTTLDLNVANVKANALTKALLNQTNQIFGDVNGTVRFTTFGADDNALQSNANGTVTMTVSNGRLPAIAKVETLLTTANVLRGGILGLNLNNIFRSLTVYDTNYFATLSGNMLINNQVLYTRNLVSDGVNLDLLIRGSLKMDSGDADMQVNGQMSQDVVGRLGFIGQLSLGKLLHYVPGLGTLGKNKAGLFGYLPGIGFVPGFGGPAGEENRFQVRLKGPLDSPHAIKDFHWVHNGHPPGSRPGAQSQAVKNFGIPFVR
jgi:hypothetical protein